VIILHDIETRLADLKELIERRAFHPYLIKNIRAPYIDEDKILLLLLMFDQLNLSDIEKETYITAILLMQLALDTHDFVHSDSKNEDLKNQQLTVLAGDYYSGLYYKHLAALKNIDLIRELSAGIKEINEQKIILHEKQQFKDIEEILNILKKIEGALFKKISKFFQVPLANDFTLNFLLVKRLLRERELIMDNGRSIGFEAVKKMIAGNEVYIGTNRTVEKNKYILHVFDQAIQETIEVVHSQSAHFPYMNELLKMKIQSIADEYQASL
jgi:heptaprenyl diphosphate synthase